MAGIIFFHGVAVNTDNMLLGVIERMLSDTPEPNRYKADQCWLKISTENSAERQAIAVDYDTACAEWARVWTPQHETACVCGSAAMFSNRVSTWGTVK